MSQLPRPMWEAILMARTRPEEDARLRRLRDRIWALPEDWQLFLLLWLVVWADERQVLAALERAERYAAADVADVADVE